MDDEEDENGLGGILNFLIEDLILEACFELHWTIKTGRMSLAELYNLVPLMQPGLQQSVTSSVVDDEPVLTVIDSKIDKKLSVVKTAPPQSLNVRCPVCSQEVHATRFAPHLEKCLKGGGQRVARRPRGSSSSSEVRSQRIVVPSVPVVVVDPHPESLVVRIKMRRGEPSANRSRVGATLEEFEKLQNNIF